MDVTGRLKFRAPVSATAGVWFTGNDGAESLFFGQLGSAGTDPLGIYHSGAWRFTINQSGNVGLGLGEATPTQRFDVMGRLKFRGNGTATAGVWFTDIAGTESAFLGQLDHVSSSPIGVYHGGAWRFVVDQNGSVGIGTTTPGSFKLAVNGKIWAQEVNVAMTNPGPDYVFEQDYDLLSLSELETYITQNKHLPEVPSAKEMEANGLNLKEMNLLLLKKVEELTLHLIDMKKQNDDQQGRINDQQTQIKNLTKKVYERK